MNYRVIKSKYLADGLSYLGFRFYKFEDGYSFEETKELNYAIENILKLKKELNLYK